MYSNNYIYLNENMLIRIAIKIIIKIVMKAVLEEHPTLTKIKYIIISITIQIIGPYKLASFGSI